MIHSNATTIISNASFKTRAWDQSTIEAKQALRGLSWRRFGENEQTLVSQASQMIMSWFPA
jgi:hypothetical protein